MSARVSIAAAIAFALAPGRAHAAPDAHTRAHGAFVAGQRAYKAADYKNAALLYEAAYAAEPDPALLFDIAQALRLSNQCADAVDYYQRFLAAVPHPPNLERVQRYIEEAQSCADALARTTAAPPPIPGTPPAVAPQDDKPATGDGEPAPVTDKPAHRAAKPAPATSDDEPAPRRVHPTRTYGIALLATGAVAIGAGAVFSLRVRDWSNLRRGVCPTGCAWNSTLATEADSYNHSGLADERVEIAAYAIGAAALAAGAWLYVRGTTEAPVEVGFARGAATISAHLRF